MSSAPRRRASVAASQPTLPAPMTTTRLPQTAVPALAASRKSSAVTARSMPGTGSVRGFWAPVAMTTKSKSSRKRETSSRPSACWRWTCGTTSLTRPSSVSITSRGIRLFGNDARDLAPQPAGQFVDHRLVAAQPQLPGHREPRRPAADHGDAPAAQGRQLWELGADAGLADPGRVHRGHGRRCRACSDCMHRFGHR